ncbi:hypothetical protein VCEM1676A_003096 [Vibrio cholerae O1 str. EM-1676A]|nr:hypothetical protein VCEM1676A_003096 [Vibrio cholerae O1 str. EM-1676A]
MVTLSNFETAELSALSTKLISRKTQKPNCVIWTLKADFSEQLSLDFDDFSL